MTREFDLNIERVLENWAVAHALREVIANAIDEQALTGRRDPEILPRSPRDAGTSATGAVVSATSTSLRTRTRRNSQTRARSSVSSESA